MRDIVLMVRIDKPVLLRNRFDLACSWSGQILSYNKILGQLKNAGNTTTLAHYLMLLEGAGLIKGLEKYSPSTIRQRASSPKFQVFNMALMLALRNSKSSFRQLPVLASMEGTMTPNSHSILNAHKNLHQSGLNRLKIKELDQKKALEIGRKHLFCCCKGIIR